MKPIDERSPRKLLLFRAKITSMGDKVHIIIPKAYHSDAAYFRDRYVVVRVTDILAKELQKYKAKSFGKMFKFRAKITSMGDKVHIIIPKAYHSDAAYFRDRYANISVAEILEEAPQLENARD